MGTVQVTGRVALGTDATTPAPWRDGRCALLRKTLGDDLLSQEDYLQVPSARAVLTAVFGMGTGVSPPPWSPGSNVSSRHDHENSIASTNVVKRVRSSPQIGRAHV